MTWRAIVGSVRGVSLDIVVIPAIPEEPQNGPQHCAISKCWGPFWPIRVLERSTETGVSVRQAEDADSALRVVLSDTCIVASTARSAQKGGQIRLYPAALASRLDQGDRPAAHAYDLGAVGEDVCSTVWAAGRRVGAVGELQRAHALDEAIRLILVRLPADVVV